MNQQFDVYPTLGSALNAQFRGHAGRDWDEWKKYFYKDAGLIPDHAERVWLGREGKHSYRGLSSKRHIRELVVGHADQACIEEIGRLADLERLELNYPVTASDLSPLLDLGSLKHLDIDSPRKIADFSPLLKLPALRTLMIENAKLLSDLDWLNSAHHLEVIGIEGGMDSNATIPSLRPLAGLRSLQAFLATSTRLTDKNLMPLAECPNLRFLGIARVAPQAEFERLKQARPDIHCSWFDPGMWKPRRSLRAC